LATNLGGPPIQIVAAGGVPITNMYATANATIFTPATGKGGMIATLVSAGKGYPVSLVNDDGTEWTP